MTTIRCIKCNKEKPLNSFHRKKTGSYGRRTECKECLSSYNKEWRLRNLERLRKYDRDRDRDRKEYYANYLQENIDKDAAKRAKRRARKNRNGIEDSPLVRAMYTMARILSITFGEPFHVDHIIPIAKGGPHSFSNLQILPAKENLRKGSKLS